MICRVFLFFLILFNSLRSEELANTRVQIRGFLYATDEGQLVLASEPNLKSCCVASEAKKADQLFISGDILPPNQAGLVVLAEGELVQDEQQRRWLKEAKLVETRSDWKSLLLCVILICLGGAIYYKKTSTISHKNNKMTG